MTIARRHDEKSGAGELTIQCVPSIIVPPGDVNTHAEHWIDRAVSVTARCRLDCRSLESSAYGPSAPRADNLEVLAGNNDGAILRTVEVAEEDPDLAFESRLRPGL